MRSPRPSLKTIDIPANLNVIAKYPIAALIKTPQPELASAFIAYVLSPDGQAILEEMGLYPDQAVGQECIEPLLPPLTERS